MRKKLMIAASTATIGLAVLGTSVASAQTATTNRQDSLVSKIAQRFNLKTEDVQKVFDEDKSEHEAKREQAMKDRLAQAVTDGTLTQAQADAIITKQTEMKTFMENLKDKTPEERHTAMKAKMDELKQWADDNNIPEGYGILGRGGPGMKMRMHRLGGPESKSDTAPQPNEAAPEEPPSVN